MTGSGRRLRRGVVEHDAPGRDVPAARARQRVSTGWHETVGSSGAGKAMNLARLGVDVTLHCLLGDDDAGRRIRHGLEAAGVTVSAVPDRRARPGT